MRELVCFPFQATFTDEPFWDKAAKEGLEVRGVGICMVLPFTSCFFLDRWPLWVTGAMESSNTCLSRFALLLALGFATWQSIKWKGEGQASFMLWFHNLVFDFYFHIVNIPNNNLLILIALIVLMFLALSFSKKSWYCSQQVFWSSLVRHLKDQQLNWTRYNYNQTKLLVLAILIGCSMVVTCFSGCILRLVVVDLVVD